MSIPKNANWESVLEFFQELSQNKQKNDNEWAAERNLLYSKIESLEVELKEQRLYNQNMQKRIELVENFVFNKAGGHTKFMGGHRKTSSDVMSSLLNQINDWTKPNTSAFAIGKHENNPHTQSQTDSDNPFMERKTVIMQQPSDKAQVKGSIPFKAPLQQDTFERSFDDYYTKKSKYIQKRASKSRSSYSYGGGHGQFIENKRKSVDYDLKKTQTAILTKPQPQQQHQPKNQPMQGTFFEANAILNTRNKPGKPKSNEIAVVVTEALETNNVTVIAPKQPLIPLSQQQTIKKKGKNEVFSFVEQSKKFKIDGSYQQAGKKLLNSKCTLKSHFDSVTSLHFCNTTNGQALLASASEDCLVKLWDINTFRNANETDNFEVLSNFRGHTGPLFSITGAKTNDNDSNPNIIYSAGSEGVIRIWQLPTSFNPIYQESDGKNDCLGVWTSHKDSIWQLVHHPKEGQLLSVSSDGTVKMWKEFDINDNVDSIEKNSNDCLLGSFIYRSNNSQFIEIPTSACWNNTNLNTLLISYIKPFLGVFDRITGKNKGLLNFEMDNNLFFEQQQINKVVTHPHSALAITAHENKYIRFFDTNSLTEVKSIIAHTDSVSELTVSNNGTYIISGGHDGSIRCWDLRKYQCLYEQPAHRKKYDEGVLSIIQHPIYSYIASSGADGLVKIYESILC